MLRGKHPGKLLTSLSSSQSVILNEILDMRLPPLNRSVAQNISFSQETNNELLTSSFTMAVEEQRYLHGWREWNLIWKCFFFSWELYCLMNSYEKNVVYYNRIILKFLLVSCICCSLWLLACFGCSNNHIICNCGGCKGLSLCLMPDSKKYLSELFHKIQQ